MSSELARIVRGEGCVPLAWAGGTSAQDYLNLGDALSPVMVALLAGRPARRVPFRSRNPRLAAVGTIGQNLAGGTVWFWGTGCSPSSGEPGRPRHSPDPGMTAHVVATRGPLSAARLGGGRLATRTFGDPVWLLPRFYRPAVEKTCELGVILHLSELADRSTTCRPHPDLASFGAASLAGAPVRLINTVTPVSPAGLKARLDEILSCRRLVSTSLHGLVFAESYGIPCLPLPSGPEAGARVLELTAETQADPRVVDLYLGLGRAKLPQYVQPRDAPTDWGAVIDAIDRLWEPATLDEQALIDSFPVDLDPLSAPEGGDVWDHPTLAAQVFSHDVAALRRADADAAAAAAAEGRRADATWARRLRDWRLPAVAAAAPPAPPRLRLTPRPGEAAAVALGWAAAPAGAAVVNLGDALSPVIVAAMSGLPVRHAAFESETERMAAVGTIAHALRGGTVHLWGTGLDASRAAPGGAEGGYAAPPDTVFHVHAMRGPFSADAMRRGGVAAPEIFGDPVYFLDRVMPLGEVEKVWDLGVILHLSELSPPTAEDPARPLPQMRRYGVPEGFADRVRIIDMYCAPTWGAIEAKLREIAACRAILSTSLHGLVIADVYGVPNAWFGFGPEGLREADPMNPRASFDHRVRDLYAGQGRARAKVVYSRREQPSDWDQLIGLSRELTAHRPDTRALFDAFPGPLAVDRDALRWPRPDGLAPNVAAD